MKRPLSPFFGLFAFGLMSTGPALAQDWRFCVGVAAGSHETVITDVFASSADGAALEHRFETFFRAKKGRTLTFQCPLGASERLDALNAQTQALQFNRQMGFSVTDLPASVVAGVVGADM